MREDKERPGNEGPRVAANKGAARKRAAFGKDAMIFEFSKRWLPSRRGRDPAAIVSPMRTKIDAKFSQPLAQWRLPSGD